MSTSTVLARASRAEWSRIWGLRSSWVFAGLITCAVVGLGLLVGIDVANNPESVPEGASAWEGARFTAMFALFGTVAMAVVTAAADHATGAIVPTLQWTPRRGVLLAARSFVIALTVTVLGVMLVVSASIVVWVLAPPRVGLPLGDGLRGLGDVVVVVGCGALLGIGLALATRSTAGALVLAIALLLVLPLLVAQLPFEWATTVSSRLPGSGALFLIFGEGPRDDMTVASARWTLCAWAAGAMAAGGWRLLRSDAGH